MSLPNANEIHYLTVSELYNINFTVTEGDTFVRDIHLLESAAKRPAMVLFGQPQFPTLLDKAAALLHSLAYHHLFADGNKRTAIKAVEIFLERNHCQVQWNKAEAEAYVLEVAQDKYPISEIAYWIGQHTQSA